MDVFELRNQVTRDYATYVRSFRKMRDDRIRQKVDDALDKGRRGEPTSIGGGCSVTSGGRACGKGDGGGSPADSFGIDPTRPHGTKTMANLPSPNTATDGSSATSHTPAMVASPGHNAGGSMTAVDISDHVQGIGYTRNATEALRDGWPGLADQLAAMLANLSAVSGDDWVAFASPLEGVDRLNRQAHLLAVWCCGPSHTITDAQWYEAAEPFRVGWIFEGMQSLGQGKAVPVVATVAGVPHRIRVPRGDGTEVLGYQLGPEGQAQLVAYPPQDPGPAVDVYSTGRAPEPTTNHLITLMVCSAAIAMVDGGMPGGPVMEKLAEITDPELRQALGALPDHPSSVTRAISPHLQDPTAVLDEGDCQIVVKSVVMLLTAAEPTTEALMVAHRMAKSVGVDLPLPRE